MAETEKIMNPVIHSILVAILFLFFIVSYLKQKRAYQLVFSVWVLSTLLKYVSDDKIFTTTLGVVQLLFFVVAIFMLFRTKNSGVKNMYNEMMHDGEENDTIETKTDIDTENK